MSKIVVSRKEFDEALTKACRFTGKVLDYTEQVGLTPEMPESLRIEGTNLDAFLSTSVHAAIEGPCPPVSVNAEDLRKIVRAVGGDDITLGMGERYLSVSAGTATYKLMLGKFEDRPEWPECEDETFRFTVQWKVLERAITRSLGVIDPKDYRDYIKTVHIGTRNSGIMVEGASAHKVASFDIDCEREGHADVMIPFGAAQTLLSSVPKDSDDVEVFGDENRLYIYMDNGDTLSFNLHVGKFIDLKDKAPSGTKELAAFDRKAMIAVAKRADVVGCGWFTMRVPDGTVIAHNAASGKEVQDKIEVGCVEECAISFRPNEIISVMELFDSERVSLHGTTPKQAMLVKGEDAVEDASVMSFIMPVTLKD